MLDQVIVVYCICDEAAKALNHRDDIQCRMSTPEVMTFAIFAALNFGCDYKKTRLVALHNRYFRKVLSHSQLVRRIHQISDQIWDLVFSALRLFLRNPGTDTFIVDSFPVKAFNPGL